MENKFMPKSEDVFRVADKLQSVVRRARNESNLDFAKTDKVKDSCGTVCCHGGWYAVASRYKETNAMGVPFFERGLVKMEKDLNFPIYRNEEGLALVEWARNNPEIWGNIYGSFMFSSSGSDSFRSPTRPNGARKLQDIVDHWREVGERIKALEPPVYKDITKELAVLPVDEMADCKVKELV